MRSGSQGAAPGGAAPLYVVLHLHKTAGTTLFNNFQRNFKPAEFRALYRHEFGFETDWVGPEGVARVDAAVRAVPEVRCLFGHLTYDGIEANLPGRAGRSVVFLREPVARVLSLYTYFKFSLPADHPLRREITEGAWSVDQWLERTSYLGLDNGLVRGLLWARFPELLTQRVLGEEHLEAAQDCLRRQWFVGLTEHFEDDFLSLAGRLDFQSFHLEPVANPSKEAAQPSRQILEAIGSRNELDARLYALGRELRERQAAEPEYARWRDLAQRRRQADWGRQRAWIQYGRPLRGLSRRFGGLRRAWHPGPPGTA